MAIHPTAIIDPKAQIDGDVEIGPHCVIDGQVRVATGCRLMHNVYVTGWTEIGEHCVLHPGVIVGHEPQDVKYDGSRSYCRIGKNTILREYVTVHRGTTPESETVVGEGCFLLAGAHVAHNCRLEDHVTLINNVLLAGHVHVGRGVTMGGGAVVHQFVRIGELAMVTGNGRVPLDIVPFAMVDFIGRIAGLNRVGLRRAEYTREDIHSIREAYRILFNEGLSTPEAIDRLGGDDAPAGRGCETLIAFLRGAGKRGLAGRSRPGSAGESLKKE